MKILVVQDRLRSGGTERQSVLLANAFAAAGHPSTLLTFRPGGALADTVAPAVVRRVLQPLDLQLDWFAPALGRTAAAIAPDIVLCMGRMANCYAGRLQRRLPSTPVIGTMRTGKSLPALFRRSLHTVRHVAANSRDARDILVSRYGVPPAQISVIYNSLVFPQAAPPARFAETRRRFGAGPDTLVALCVAMFRPEKNQRELIDLVAGLPPAFDLQLWLAGDGPERPACEAVVAARGLGQRVKFVGFHRDPSALYGAADVAVHASASESLSNFLIEAQAHGRPAVAYAAQGIAECFIDQRTGWVIARGDHDAFRARLIALQAAPRAEREERSAAARAFARERFDPARQVAAYLNLFADLRAGSPDSTASPTRI